MRVPAHVRDGGLRKKVIGGLAFGARNFGEKKVGGRVIGKGKENVSFDSGRCKVADIQGTKTGKGRGEV